MDEFLNSMKAALRAKIIRESEDECYACLIQEPGWRHSCWTPDTVERHFNYAFNDYYYSYRYQVKERLKKCLLEEVFVESGLSREEARSKVADSHLVDHAVTHGGSDAKVTSTTAEEATL